MFPSNSIVLDAGGPVFLFALATPVVIVLMIVVVLLEGVLLKVMKWHASWLKCMLYSLAANAVSALAGCVLVFFLPVFGQTESSPDRSLTMQLMLSLLIAFVVSVLLEWAVLAALQPVKKREAFKPALVINIASYILLALVAVLVGSTLG